MTDNTVPKVIRAYTMTVAEHEGAPGKVFISTTCTDDTKYDMKDAPPSLLIYAQLCALAQLISEQGLDALDEDDTPPTIN
jgi:hypothetical protein